MKILDNNALSYATRKGVKIVDHYYITPDIRDEYEAGFDDSLPKEVGLFAVAEGLDLGTYLRHYKRMLNEYSGRSFYNMRGFGDISVLALLLTIKESRSSTLPLGIDPVLVVSSDATLIKHIQKEFSDPTDYFDQSLSVEDEKRHFKA